MLAGCFWGAAQAREVVAFHDGVAPGSVVISAVAAPALPRQRRRHRDPLSRCGRQARQAVVRHDRSIDGKYVAPAWSPPAEVKRDNPRLPTVIAGGSPHNPMGAAAMTLAGGEYAIHGTNRPSSVGTYASYGCIRMYNQDVVDLYGRVDVGTQVYVTR